MSDMADTTWVKTVFSPFHWVLSSHTDE